MLTPEEKSALIISIRSLERYINFIRKNLNAAYKLDIETARLVYKACTSAIPYIIKATAIAEKITVTDDIPFTSSTGTSDTTDREEE